MKKTIYELELHETLIVTSKTYNEDGDCNTSQQLQVTRVPGGWMYNSKENWEFVPFNKEFQKTRPNDIRLVHNLLNG